MKKYSVSTPEGTRDKLFSECSLRRELTNSLKSLFSRRGYQEVITPSVEYYDVFLDSGTPLEPESMLKLIDRAGRILVMRPDVTTPIARIAATKLSSVDAPYRLFYVQNVFRSDIEHSGRSMETLQAGVELLGASGIRPDVEMIALAVESLDACALNDYRLEIGHAGFFKAITAALGAPADKIEEMRRLVEEKNFAALNDVIKEYGVSPYSTALRKLPQLFGGVEVLDEALSLIGNADAVEAISYLRRIYSELEAAGLSGRVMIDLGLVNQINYYTGVIFRGYTSGAGSAVLSGGRYDQLAAAFGKKMPATGFAIDIDALSDSVKLPDDIKLQETVWYEDGYLKDALLYINRMPSGSIALSAAPSREKALDDALSKGIKLTVIGNRGVSQ